MPLETENLIIKESKSGYGGRVQHLSLGPKYGAMARTIPTALEAIPVKMAPEMCARGGMLVNIPFGIAIGRDLP